VAATIFGEALKIAGEAHALPSDERAREWRAEKICVYLCESVAKELL